MADKKDLAWELWNGPGDSRLTVSGLTGSGAIDPHLVRCSLQFRGVRDGSTVDYTPFSHQHLADEQHQRFLQAIAEDKDAQRLAAANKELTEGRRLLHQAERKLADAEEKQEQMAMDCAAGLAKHAVSIVGLRGECEARRTAVEQLERMQRERAAAAELSARRIASAISLEMAKAFRDEEAALDAEINRLISPLLSKKIIAHKRWFRVANEFIVAGAAAAVLAEVAGRPEVFPPVVAELATV